MIRKSYWEIAYRYKGNKWIYVKNPNWGWAADPFIFIYQDNAYIFAEIMSYRTGKGSIGFYSINSPQTGWNVIISESAHLSYPFLIKKNNDIYMIVEKGDDYEIPLYKCIDFPFKWEKSTTISSGKRFLDTTPLFLEDKIYLFTFIPNDGNILIGDLAVGMMNENFEMVKDFQIVKKHSFEVRPGGAFYKDKTFYRVAQNCKGEYGKELLFYEVIDCRDDIYEEKLVGKKTVHDFDLKSRKRYIGIHTYNKSKDYEVIDIKSKRISLREYYWKLKRKIAGIIGSLC